MYLIIFIFCLIFSFIPIFPTKTALKNIHERLDITGIRARFFVAIMYINYFFYLIEILLFEPLKLNICVCDDFELFAKAADDVRKNHLVAKNKGLVYISFHKGNVEMCTIPIIQDKLSDSSNRTLYALAKPSPLKIVNKFLDWYRVRPGMGVVWTNRQVVKNMKEKRKDEKASLWLLMDQKPKNGGLFLKFFGKFAAFPYSGLKFCMQENMLVAYASSQRIIPGYSKIKFILGKNLHLKMDEIINQEDYKSVRNDADNEIYNLNGIDKNVALELASFANWIESEIKKNPTQWSWDYKKWSREPDF